MLNLIGYIAAFLTTTSLLPQVIRTLKTRETCSISLTTYIIFVIGIAFWLFYGILLKNPIIISSNAITLVLGTIILVTKIRNHDKS